MKIEAAAPMDTKKLPPNTIPNIELESNMRVRKRNGSLEPVDIAQITKQVARCGAGLRSINPYLIASKAISGIYDGVSTKELDSLLIQTSAMLISEEPEYSKLAARLLTTYTDKELSQAKLNSFSQSITYSYKCGLISDETYQFVITNRTALDASILEERCDFFEYFGPKSKTSNFEENFFLILSFNLNPA